ncbi:MAG: NAD(+) synthase [Gemmatimonadetes bacterium]|nr:NAD(+) synthase [Gemmatimonadota bacterium]
MLNTVENRLRVDPERVTEEISAVLRNQVAQVLRRSGLVVAMSGGIDSSVCAALAVKALGPRRVLGLAFPERESDNESLVLAARLARKLDIELVVEDITPALEGAGCYARRDKAIERLTPYGPGWRSKLVFEGGLDTDRLPLSHLTVSSPAGDTNKIRLPAREFREIVAATNFKQRVRTMMTYFHADRLQYAVMGTPNRLEYELGFFVKGGDGLADVKPIAHLYKSQVYQLAEHLGVPAEIRSRVPTTDTYSLPQTQEEFFFSLPLLELDLVLQAHDEGSTAEETAAELGLTAVQVAHVFRDIDRKRAATRYLHQPALLVPSPEHRLRITSPSPASAASGRGE